METNDAPSVDTQPDVGLELTGAPDAASLGAPLEMASGATEHAEAETPRAPRRRWIAMIPLILFGAGMFVLGGVGGFVGRPYIIGPTPTMSAAQQQQAKMQGLLDMLVSKTRHFKGNAGASVTVLEFGDFQ